MLVTDMRPGDVIAVGAAAMMLTYRSGRASLLIDAPQEVRVALPRAVSEALASARWTREGPSWYDHLGQVDVKRVLEDARRLTCKS